MLSLSRRSLIELCGAAVGLACMVSVSRSDEVSARASVSGLVIHDADETLALFCHEESGVWWFVLPSGARFELVTDPSQLPNPGDGSFHAFDAATVRQAIASVRFPMDQINAEIFILPYPRRDALQSAAGPDLMLLSPGVTALDVDQQHATVVHELGHLVQYRFMPDSNDELWSRYRDLRGLDDPLRFSAEAPHADRPHEIFAEDFRALYGDPLANYSGTIENQTLAAPQRVVGLEAFISSLEAAPLTARAIAAFPNPARAAVGFRRGGEHAALIDVFDPAGRRVATLAPTPLATGWQWRWDGRDAGGAPVARGLYFARERGAGSSSRFVVE